MIYFRSLFVSLQGLYSVCGPTGHDCRPTAVGLQGVYVGIICIKICDAQQQLLKRMMHKVTGTVLNCVAYTQLPAVYNCGRLLPI